MKNLDIIFAGTPDFAVPSLEALNNSPHNVSWVFTQPDRPKGRGKKLQPSPIKDHALNQGIAVYQPSSLRDPAILDDFERPDFMIVVAYGLILPKHILEFPKFGCINVHASLLPSLRGAAPIQYAILNGLKQTGITIMQIESKLDAGKILKQGSIVIEDDDSTLTLSKKLANLGSHLLLEVIDNYENISSMIQDEKKVSYAPKIDKSMSKINWQEPAIKINRLVRALDPNPVAYTEFNDTRIKIFQTQIIDSIEGEPGQIIDFSAKGLDIATGSGLIRVTKCQFPGKKVIDANNIYNAYRNYFDLGKKFS